MTAPGPAFIGLTGAMASGKSTALAALERLGAATLSTDQVAHTAYEDAEVRDSLTERWGAEVAPDGVVDRARVGEIVFGNPAELTWLESLTHPYVGRKIFEWRTSLPGATEVAVVEVPLLFEAGMEEFFDATLVIAAADGDREAWAGARGTTDAAGRSGRQLTQEDKAARATFVVLNDGTLDELEAKLAELWPQLVAAGGGEV